MRAKKQHILEEIGRKLQNKPGDWPRIDEEKYLHLEFKEKMHIYGCFFYACSQGWDKDFSRWYKYLKSEEAAGREWSFQPPAEELQRILAKVEDPAGVELTGYFILEAVHYSINVGTANEKEKPTSAKPRYKV